MLQFNGGIVEGHWRHGWATKSRIYPRCSCFLISISKSIYISKKDSGRCVYQIKAKAHSISLYKSNVGAVFTNDISSVVNCMHSSIVICIFQGNVSSHALYPLRREYRAWRYSRLHDKCDYFCCPLTKLATTDGKLKFGYMLLRKGAILCLWGTKAQSTLKK